MANLIDALRQKLRIWLSLPETKNTFYVGITSLAADRDRLAYSRWVGRGQSSLIAPEIYALEYTLETGIPLGMSYFHCITVKIDCNKNSEILVHILNRGFANPELTLRENLNSSISPRGTCAGKLGN